jgi:uncharacterized membrane protein
MNYTGAYAVVLIVHLILAIVVIGPLLWTSMLSPRWVKEGAVDLLRSGLRVTRLYGALSVLVPLVGFGLLSLTLHGNRPYGVGDAWVSISLTLYVIATLVGFLVIAPAQAKAVKAIETGQLVPPAGGDPDGEAPSAPGSDETRMALLKGRLEAGSRVIALAYVVIVIMMVTKPGA